MTDESDYFHDFVYKGPPTKVFKCPEHGHMTESGVFPNTLGVFVEKYPGGPKVRFCPVCFYNMVRADCFELKEVPE